MCGMPIYEYSCEKCNKVHEIIQKFSDPAVERCPDCGSPVTKQVSLSSFSLKGTGWYSTDYKKTSSPQAAAAKGDGPMGDSKGDAKVDLKSVGDSASAEKKTGATPSVAKVSSESNSKSAATSTSSAAGKTSTGNGSVGS